MIRALSLSLAALLAGACTSGDAESSGIGPCAPGEIPLGAGDCLKLLGADAGLSVVEGDAGTDNDAGDGGAP